MSIQSTKSFDSFEILVKLAGGFVAEIIGLSADMIGENFI